MEEIKAALFNMEPLNAPGPDGFHACFYQQAWSVIGNYVFKQFSSFMDSGTLEEGMNDTLITLVPKNNCPTNASHFHPISLCNVIYKIITKTLTNRIKPILTRLIGLEQSSFVPDYHITDNILVYQEVLHLMFTKNSAMRHMTYDRLDWEFIRDTLTNIGMNEKWVKSIMTCVESSKLSILWKGKQLQKIESS